MDSILLPCEERLQTANKKKNIRFSIPKENSNEDTRIAITPQGVEVLAAQGHEIVIERQAGKEAQFSDTQYSEAGAKLVNHAEAFDSDLIIKMSLPTEDDLQYIKEGQSIACFVTQHKRDKKIFQALAKKRCNIIALDFICNDNDEPILNHSLGEIEGMLAVTTAARLLEHTCGGKGVIIGGISGVPPTEILIIGTDMAALRATQTAIALGASVKIFGNQHSDIQQISHLLPSYVFTSVLHPQALIKAMASADVVIGTRTTPGKFPYIVNEETIKLMKPGAIIIDLNTNLGGRFETSKPTTIKSPTYTTHSIIHHCLNNISILAPHTTAIVLSDILTPIITNICNIGGLANAIRDDRYFANGIVMLNGTTTNEYIANTFGTDFCDINLLRF